MAPVALIGLLIANGTNAPTIVSYGGIERPFEAQELLGMADAVVVAKYTGESNVHWNSADGKAWSGTGPDDYPLVYRDDTFEIVRTIRGGTLPDHLVIRGVGGTADGVTVVFEGQPKWKVGEAVVLLIAFKDTPLEAGTEKAWTLVANHQGAFRAVGADWASDMGLKVRERDLAN
ncbi:MAG TPA: hypothetical protein VFI15_08395 [Candidatus Limnocylindrales bacterium]|nr:hypothetical protein [Candidatus Limnocylindrales bacterium]